MGKYQVIDEQTKVKSISFEWEFAKLKYYEQTAERLNKIMEKERGRISTALGGKIFINTIDRKKLAPEIVRWLNCRLDEHGLKSKSNENYIREDAQSWLQSIVEQETGTPTPNQYADFVLAKARDQFKLLTQEEWGDDTDYEVYYRNTAPEFSERLEAVEEWAKMKREQPAETFILPTELDTPEAQKYFDRAIQKGLMSEDYKWLSGLEMLACFASEMSKKLNLGKGENSDGTKRISWKPFETLFKLKSGTLKSNLKDIKRTGDNPKDVDMIDQIFKD